MSAGKQVVYHKQSNARLSMKQSTAFQKSEQQFFKLEKFSEYCSYSEAY